MLQVVEDLCMKLQKSDETYMEMERKVNGLEESLREQKNTYNEEVEDFTRKLTKLSNENKKLSKQLEETTKILPAKGGWQYFWDKGAFGLQP